MSSPRAWQQTTALLYKNAALQRSQRANTICQLLVPIILVSIVGLLQWLVDTRLASSTILQPADEFPAYSVSDSESHRPGTDFITLPYYHFQYDPVKVDGSALGFHDKDGSGSGLLKRTSQQDFWWLWQKFLRWPFTATPGHTSVADLDDSLIEMYTFWRDLANDTRIIGSPNISIPYKLVDNLTDWFDQRDYKKLLPLGAYLFNRYNISVTDQASQTLADRRNSQLRPEIDLTVMPAGRYGGWRIPYMGNQSLVQRAFPEIDRKANMINTINNALLRELSDSDDLSITAYFQAFTQKQIPSLDLASIAGFHLFGFAVSFLLPTFVANIVLDKQEKCLIMMRMSGLRMSVYWFANWIYQMIVFVLVMVCMYAAGWAFQMRLFTQTSPWLLALVLGLWGNVLISFSFLLSTAFNKAREASIVSYFLVIMGVIVSNLLNGSVFLSENPPFWFLLYPPFAFYRCLFIIVEACVNLQCLDLSSVFGAATGIATQRRLDGILLLLIAQSLFMFFLAWYVAEISPKEWGVRQSPLFCLRPAFRWLSRNKSQRQNEGENDDEEAALLGNGEDYFIAEKKLDEDVMAERRMILGSWDKIATESTLIINELTKTYQNSDRAAVEPICLAIRRGECFGLLGLNGAGKTTLLSCLTGMLEPSSGTATFFGEQLDLRQDISAIQTRVGVCLQFDVFYPTLSCMEHLEFYSRLKGGISDIKKHSLELLEAVGLRGATHKLAKDLSGGMRRRLSMAIALIGNPQLIFLDECTTGLDPLTKQQLWQVFGDIRSSRPANNPLTVFMTTHYMEEADSLCSRVAIMTGGQLRCLGPPEYLKQKFGNGCCTLSVRVDEVPASSNSASPPHLLDLIHGSVTGNQQEQQEHDFNNSEYQRQSRGVRVAWRPDTSLSQCVSYDLQPIKRQGFYGPVVERLTLGPLFRTMNDLIARQTVVQVAANVSVRLKDWAVNATSLEDVFLSIVKRYRQQ